MLSRSPLSDPKVSDNSKLVQKKDAAPGEILGTPAGGKEGNLQDQIRPRTQDLLSADIFVIQSRLSPLHVITAHSNDNIIGLCQSSRFLQNICMPLVKGITFHDDTGYFHMLFCSFLSCQMLVYDVEPGQGCRPRT